jgi:DNA polymerase III subunit epsilon
MAPDYLHHLDDAVFTVIDLETTGGVSMENRITEVSALKVVGGDIVDELTTLLNPEIPISYFISQYTGITNEMVKFSPKAKDILPTLVSFLGTSVFVAHNAQFDFGFVALELARAGLPALENKTLCTVRLARRLLPKTIRKNLGDLSAYFGIEIQNRHRARGDAEATVGVLKRLIEIAADKHGVETLDELLSLQFKTMRVFKKEPKHVRKIRDSILPDIPEKPGIYFMKNQRGELLYIGKSKNLKSRVGSYFTESNGQSEKVRELVSHIRRIDVQACGSELEALLLESRLIKLHRPRFNSLLKRYKSYPFLRLTRHDFPRLEIALEIKDDGAEYFGPFYSQDTVREVFDTLNKNFLLRECDDHELVKGRACVYLDLHRCLAPCEPKRLMELDYMKELQRVRNFLSGENAELLDKMTEKMRRLAAEFKFEDAADLRGRIASLKRVFYRQSSVTASINENNVMILLPGENFSATCKAFLVLFVRFGRLISQTNVLIDDALTLQETVERTYFSGAEMPKTCRKDEIDEMQILSSWIYHNRETLSCLYIRPEHMPENVMEHLTDRLLKLSSEPNILFETPVESSSDVK